MFLLWVAEGGESYCPWNPYIDTRFPESFNIKNLDKIKVGMEKPEVIGLIGEPLYKRNGAIEWYSINGQRFYRNRDDIEVYIYSSDGASNFGDWAWLSIRIWFKDDTVNEIFIRWQHD
jgi:hypothetical protein